jgi:hypothetical protein
VRHPVSLTPCGEFFKELAGSRARVLCYACFFFGGNQRMLTRYLAVFLLTLAPLLLLGQASSTPDFSGTWILNLQKSQLAKDSKITVEAITITNSGPSIQFRVTINGEDSMQTFIVDGKEHLVNETQTGKTVEKAAWKKSVLTTETMIRMKLPNGLAPDFYHQTDHWTLAGDGRTLTRELTEFDKRRTLVYDRQ